MSYILDALKKAEAERRVGTPVGPHAALPTVHDAPLAERKAVMRTPWPWVAMTAIAAWLAAYSWLRPAPAIAPVAAPQPAAHAQPATPAAPALAPAEPPMQQATSVQPPAPPPPAAAEEQPALPKPKSAKTSKAVEKKHAAAETTTAEPAAPSLPTMRELPENIQREIPQLKVGGYIYSGSKADRSVIINSRLLHEGEEAAPGLTLERMMPNGMVLNYRGYRYRAGY